MVYIQDACLVASVTATRCGLSRGLDPGPEIIPNKLFDVVELPHSCKIE